MKRQVGIFHGVVLLAATAVMQPLEAKEVRVYSGRHYNTDREVYKKFSQETGIKVRLIEASGISLVERLKREGSNSKADVIMLVDAARINNAARAGLLAPIQSKQLVEDVPKKFRDPSNRWFGLTRRVRAIIINPSKIQAGSIKSYADLAKPEFKGKLCLRKRKNVYNQSLVADQVVLKGQAKATQWVKGLVSNVEQPYFSGDISLIRAVGQGKCGIGVVNHYYFARMQAGKTGQKDQTISQSVQLIMPNPAHVNISAAGLAKSAKNRSEGIQLIEYLASPKGSQELSGPTYEYPLKGYGTSKQLKAFGQFNPDNVSISQLADTQKMAIQIMAENGWR